MEECSGVCSVENSFSGLCKWPLCLVIPTKQECAATQTDLEFGTHRITFYFTRPPLPKTLLKVLTRTMIRPLRH